MHYLYGDKKEGQRGAALVATLLVLAVLSLAGAASLTRTAVEIEATGNVKRNKMAFYAACAGIEMMPRLIYEAMRQGQNPANTPIIAYGDFYSELTGTDANDLGDTVFNNPDVQTTFGSCTVAVDVWSNRGVAGRLVTPVVVYGRSAKQGRGGATYLYYNLTSCGTEPAGGTAMVGAEFRYLSR